MEKIINILWVSLNAPTKKADKAGGNTFNYYFKAFYNDPEFKVKIIAQINNDLPLMNINSEDCFYLKREGGFKNKIKRLSSIESKYNPFNRNANLISNQMEGFTVKNIKLLKGKGFLPDVVILEWTQCVVMAEKIKRLLPNAKLIASEHDLTFVAYRRMADFYKGLKGLLWQYRCRHEKKVEMKALKLCDVVLPHNPDNAEVLKQEGIAESGIQWLVPYFNNMGYIKRRPNNRDVLFFGAMSRPENYLSAIWFIENVMPKIKDLDVRFVVLGSSPNEKLKAYESERVHITGFVDSVEPYFEQSVCLAAPLVLGAGIKIKVLEALSSGIPVLTNDIGIEGIPAANNREYIHCETPEEYEAAIRNIFSGKINIQELTANSKKFTEKNYSFENSLTRYKNTVLGLKGNS